VSLWLLSSKKWRADDEHDDAAGCGDDNTVRTLANAA
jgi:hypothetical protein